MLIIYVFLLPFFFLPITSDYYNFNKQFLLYFVVLFSLFSFTKNLYKSKRLEFSFSPLDKYVLLFLASIWISFLLSVPFNSLSSVALAKEDYFLLLTSLFGPLTFTALILLYFLLKISNSGGAGSGFARFTHSLLFSGLIFSFLMLFQQFNLNPINKNPYWSPLGYFPNVIVFAGIIAVISLTYLIQLLKKHFGENIAINIRKKTVEIPKHQTLFTALAVSSFIASFALLVSSLSLSQSNNPLKPFVLSQKSAWQISVASLKDFKNALFGVGSGNYSLAVSQNRPESLYPKALSSQTISMSSNFFLQILTEYGLISLILLISLISRILSIFITRLKEHKLDIDASLSFSGIFSFLVFQLLNPPSFIALVLFFVFLAFIENGQEKIFSFVFIKNNFSKLILILLLTSYFLLFTFLTRIYLADVFYHNAISSVNKGENSASYNNIIFALSLNDKNPYYHLYLADLYKKDALALARLENRSQEYNEKMKNYISSSISEMQSAVILSPNNPVFSFEMGKLYMDYLGFLKGSDDRAIEYLTKSIKIDKTNTNYYFLLGKAHIAKGNYQLAQKELELAVMIDPTFSNAYYNLYYTLLKQGLNNQALSALVKTKDTLSSSHRQYDQIVSELNDFTTFIKEGTMSGNLKQNFGSLGSVEK